MRVGGPPSAGAGAADGSHPLPHPPHAPATTYAGTSWPCASMTCAKPKAGGGIGVGARPPGHQGGRRAVARRPLPAPRPSLALLPLGGHTGAWPGPPRRRLPPCCMRATAQARRTRARCGRGRACVGGGRGGGRGAGRSRAAAGVGRERRVGRLQHSAAGSASARHPLPPPNAASGGRKPAAGRGCARPSTAPRARGRGGIARHHARALGRPPELAWGRQRGVGDRAHGRGRVGRGEHERRRRGGQRRRARQGAQDQPGPAAGAWWEVEGVAGGSRRADGGARRGTRPRRPPSLLLSTAPPPCAGPRRAPPHPSSNRGWRPSARPRCAARSGSTPPTAAPM